MPTQPHDPSGYQPGSFLDWLEVRSRESGDGHSKLELVVGPQHLRSRDILHGGVIASLLDTALGLAAATKAPAGLDVVTVQLNLNYIRPGWPGESLVAIGTVVHSGRRTAVAQGEVRTSDRSLMAVATGTFMFVEPADLTLDPSFAGSNPT